MNPLFAFNGTLSYYLKSIGFLTGCRIKSLSIRRIQKGNVGNISTEGSVQQPLSPVPEAVTDHARVEVAGPSPGHVPDLVTLSSGE